MPKVLVHILPLFAMSKCGKVTSLRNMQTKVEHATACYDSLVAVVKQEVGRHTFYKINKIVIQNNNLQRIGTDRRHILYKQTVQNHAFPQVCTHARTFHLPLFVWPTP